MATNLLMGSIQETAVDNVGEAPVWHPPRACRGAATAALRCYVLTYCGLASFCMESFPVLPAEAPARHGPLPKTRCLLRMGLQHMGCTNQHLAPAACDTFSCLPELQVILRGCWLGPTLAGASVRSTCWRRQPPASQQRAALAMVQPGRMERRTLLT